MQCLKIADTATNQNNEQSALNTCKYMPSYSTMYNTLCSKHHELSKQFTVVNYFPSK